MTKQDMELTRLAAKAAGIEGVNFDRAKRDWAWNPLDDDGDALRLALKLDIVFRCINGVAFAWKNGLCDMQEPYSDDRCAAVRRTIVLAAAEIGKQMENKK